MAIKFAAHLTAYPNARLIRTQFWDKHTPQNGPPTAETLDWNKTNPRDQFRLGVRWNAGPKALLIFRGQAFSQPDPLLFRLNEGAGTVASSVVQCFRETARKGGYKTWIHEIFTSAETSPGPIPERLFDFSGDCGKSGIREPQYRVRLGVDWEGAVFEVWCQGKRLEGSDLNFLWEDLRQQFRRRRRVSRPRRAETLVECAERVLADAAQNYQDYRLAERFPITLLSERDIRDPQELERAALHLTSIAMSLQGTGKYKDALDANWNAAHFLRAAWLKSHEPRVLGFVFECCNNCLTVGRPFNLIERPIRLAKEILALGVNLDANHLSRFQSELGQTAAECGYRKDGLKMCQKANLIGEQQRGFTTRKRPSDTARILLCNDRRIGELIGKTDETDTGFDLLESTVLGCDRINYLRGLGNTVSTFVDVYCAHNQNTMALDWLEANKLPISYGAEVTRASWRSAHAVLSILTNTPNKDKALSELEDVYNERLASGTYSPLGVDCTSCMLYRPDLVLQRYRPLEKTRKPLVDRSLGPLTLDYLRLTSKAVGDCARRSRK